jgi:hypothetical protein
MPNDFLPVLRFTGPRKDLPAREFDQFLNDLHDYLLLTYGEGKGPELRSSP